MASRTACVGHNGAMQRIVVLSGGVGGARFLEGVRAARPDADITVVANTADDLWIFGVRVCPDLDSIMYTLGGGIDPERGWGRAAESWNAREELAAYGASGSWFGLGDRDLATHLVRSQQLREGIPLSAVTRTLCDRWQPGVTLLPMTDSPVETHVDIADEDGVRSVHFQEYWIRYRAQVALRGLRYQGVEAATPGPGVVEAISAADAVLFAPSNPVVSIRPILMVSGIAEALRATAAPVVGVSPIIAGGHVHGMADQLLTGLGHEVGAAAVAEFHGAREAGGVLDGWLVDDSDADQLERLTAGGITARSVPLYMRDEVTTRTLAADALALAGELTEVV